MVKITRCADRRTDQRTESPNFGDRGAEIRPLRMRRADAHLSTKALRNFGFTCALLLVISACGSDADAVGSAADSTPASSAPADSTSTESDSMGDMEGMDDMEGGSMNMGDPDATPANEVEDATVAEGSFELLDTRPEDHDDLTGTAAAARTEAGTTVTVEFEGMVAGTDYIAHLHEESCETAGGDHYQFEEDGPEVPPNEIHLAFTAAEDGSGFMTAENDQKAGPEGAAVVVHPTEFLDNKIACADLS